MRSGRWRAQAGEFDMPEQSLSDRVEGEIGKTCPRSSNSPAGGTHGVIATYSGDAANAGSTSPTLSEVVAVVTDTTPPVVTITSPANSATVAGIVTIGANATDYVAVAGLTLAVDAAVVATTNGAPGGPPIALLVPEPQTLLLVALGLIALASRRMIRKA
jgi:Bacterial Ig domain/PEP-CTERM motif